MKQRLYLWLAPFLLNSRFTHGECYGVADFVFGTSCREQYLDCESCIIGSTLHPSCHGWCPSSGYCAGGFAADGISLVQCADTEVALDYWCPVDSANPPFNNQECIFASWEWYSCTQIVDDVGGCDANYVTNYCEVKEQRSAQLCDGYKIQVVNPDYPFGGLSLGYFLKTTNGLKIEFGPGQGLYTTACYRFNYGPITDDYMCSAGDSYVLKYTVTLEGPMAPAPVPTTSPVTPPVVPPTSPLPTNPPVTPPVPTRPSASPEPVPSDPPHSFSTSPEPVPTDPPQSFSTSPEPQPMEAPQAVVPRPAPISPSVAVPIRMPTSPPISAAHGISFWTAAVIVALAWFLNA